MEINMDDPSHGPVDASAPGTVKFQHHTLVLSHPAISLLPANKEPFLEVPNGLADREEPGTDPLELSAGDLAFFIRFETSHSYTDAVAICEGDRSAMVAGTPPLVLSASIARLSAFAGKSELAFVSYVEDDDVLTRFSLTTTYYANSGKVLESKREFEMGSAALNRLIRTLHDEEEWVRLLDDLISGDSDRAYLNRTVTLDDYEAGWSSDEEGWWGLNWDENGLRSARQILLDRLVKLSMSDDGTMSEDPIGDLDDCRNVELYVGLPCGHRHILPPNSVQNMSPRDAITATCPDCEQRIWREQDKDSFQRCRDRIKRTDWQDATEDWEPKCRTVRNDATAVSITSGALIASLFNAPHTFKLRESMNPREMCPTTYPATQSLLGKLTDTLRANPSIPPTTPKALFKNLEDLAWRLIKEIVGDDTLHSVVLPPGFDDFVSRWLTRAVNDVVGDQADDDKDLGLMEAMDKMKRSKIDPELQKVEDDLDDILSKIGGTGLGKEEHRGEDEQPRRINRADAIQSMIQRNIQRGTNQGVGAQSNAPHTGRDQRSAPNTSAEQEAMNNSSSHQAQMEEDEEL